ncbi:hypothetical protein LXA43DRAFT_1068474 [Ganoderma leucocontextum]|nr:hypothetical protein LXA43DRAFT_1068474 [Ganoderma leucocontextum]
MICITARLVPSTRISVLVAGPEKDLEYVEHFPPHWPSSHFLTPSDTIYHIISGIASRWTLTSIGEDTSTPLHLNSVIYFSDHRGFLTDIPALCALHDLINIIAHEGQWYFVISSWVFEDNQTFQVANKDSEDEEAPKHGSTAPVIASADFCLPVHNFQSRDLPVKLALLHFLPLQLARWLVKKRYEYVLTKEPKPLHNCLGIDESIIRFERVVCVPVMKDGHAVDEEGSMSSADMKVRVQKLRYGNREVGDRSVPIRLVLDQSFKLHEDWSRPVFCSPFIIPTDREPGPGRKTGLIFLRFRSGPIKPTLYIVVIIP